MGFTDELLQRAAPIWEAAHQHPFVRGIGDGTLPINKFKFYIRQDYVFLIEFSRVLALGAARAHDLDSMARYARLLDATLNGEMELHRGYCARFGITRSELEATSAAPATHAYTRHLLHVAESGTPAELAAALIPCMRGYAEIGAVLAAQGEPASQPLYGEWIRTYAAPEFREIADWCCDLLNRLVEQAGPPERARIEEAFQISCRYEFGFWQMAWTMEEWPEPSP